LPLNQPQTIMSDTTNETIAHNVYFDGKVQSLGLQTDKGRATVGVMKKGEYRFSASSPEKMVIISGILDVQLLEGKWIKYAAQGEFDVPAGTSFDVSCDSDVAYICYYG